MRVGEIDRLLPCLGKMRKALEGEIGVIAGACMQGHCWEDRTKYANAQSIAGKTNFSYTQTKEDRREYYVKS